ncbi:FixH family protein [Haloprofundus salilacus]|uniref:FixH family protein n=1 Tax=Haloprofundus salilacus TaxID=2876190 RepID=UPI001CCAA076|nr:FixH family protein [Haloprofundus salilacus]
MYARVGGLLLSVLLLLSGGAVVVADNPDYSITVQDSVDVPERTITLAGTDYDVSKIAPVDPGEQLVVDTFGPSGESYKVYFYNSDKQIIDKSSEQSGTSSVTFETDSLTPGSYIVAIFGPEGDFEKIHPVVINGYDISLSTPESATAGDVVEMTVDVSPRQNAPEMSEVEVAIVAKGSETQTVTATKEGDEYVASLTLDESGSYNVYANVRGTDTYNGQKELLALTQTQALSVSEPTNDDAGGNDGDGSSNSQDGSSDDSETTSSATETPTESTQTPTETTQVPTESTTSTTSPTATSTQTMSDVITPNETSSVASETTSTTTPGFSSVLAIVALLGSCGLWLTRR